MAKLPLLKLGKVKKRTFRITQTTKCVTSVITDFVDILENYLHICNERQFFALYFAVRGLSFSPARRQASTATGRACFELNETHVQF